MALQGILILQCLENLPMSSLISEPLKCPSDCQKCSLCLIGDYSTCAMTIEYVMPEKIGAWKQLFVLSWHTNQIL